MSVQLCCWRQNGDASERDPGSSHVHPAENESYYLRTVNKKFELQLHVKF